MNMPLVSIIVPAYNVEQYIAVCLNSLIEQTYSNIEIIVINDGSTDNTFNLLQEFQLKDSRILLYNQENKGLSETRNVGIQYASGEYICFLDSDDWIDKETIEKAVEAIHGYDVVLWGYVKEFETSSLSQPLAMKKEVYDSKNINSLLQRIVGPVNEQLSHPEMLDSYVTAWGKLYRSDIIKDKKLLFVSTKIIGTEDLLFNVQYFYLVGHAIILPECFNHYRKTNSGSLTSNYKARLFEQWTALQNYLWEEVKGNEFLEKAFYNRIACTMIGLGLNEYSANLSCSAHKKNILGILNSARYMKAFQQLPFSYFPIYWKVFFYSCKHRNFFIYWSLIKMIHRIITRK